jgi:hypothetical protein
LTSLPGWTEFSLNYPTFLHTVAHVRFLAAKANPSPDPTGFERALAAIEDAIRIQDMPLYQTTRDNILNELKGAAFSKARTADRSVALPKAQSQA